MQDLQSNPLYIPPEITKLTREELAMHLRNAWKTQFQKPITIEQLAILWSQVCLETDFLNQIRNYNFGNIKRRPNQFFTAFPCNEYINGVRKTFQPPDPQTHFCAWKTPETGVYGYINFLANKYSLAIEAIKQENIESYVAALKKIGYFTADQTLYLNRMKQIRDIFYKTPEKFFPAEPAPEPIPAPEPKPTEPVKTLEPIPSVGSALAVKQAPTFWDRLFEFFKIFLALFRK